LVEASFDDGCGRRLMTVGGRLLVSLSTALVLGLAIWAVVRFAGEIRQALRRRLAMLRNDEFRGLGARR
jgi:hypothetical protein